MPFQPTESELAYTRSTSDVREVAQDKVDLMVELKMEENWSTESHVTEIFPVYLEGVDEVSYYECKVQTKGKDSGFVLVNVNQTDLSVPEFCAKGKTVTEQYREELGRDDFDLIRYDWVNHVPVAKGKAKKLKNALSYKKTTFSKETLQKMANKIRKKKCAAIYNKKDLKKQADFRYYKQKKATRGTYIENYKTCELDPKHTYDNGEQMPNWGQRKFYRSDGREVLTGCGPVAWAMVLAYWHQFKNISELFGGIDLYWKWGSGETKYNPKIKATIQSLYYYLDCFSDLTQDWTATPVSNMGQAMDFVESYGYQTSYGTMKGTERNKFEKVKENLDQDRPVILYITNSGIIADHYVVISKGILDVYQYKYLGTYTRQVFYKVCFGHPNKGSENYKWIRTYSQIFNPGLTVYSEEYYSAYDIFYCSITPRMRWERFNPAYSVYGYYSYHSVEDTNNNGYDDYYFMGGYSSGGDLTIQLTGGLEYQVFGDFDASLGYGSGSITDPVRGYRDYDFSYSTGYYPYIQWEAQGGSSDYITISGGGFDGGCALSNAVFERRVYY